MAVMKLCLKCTTLVEPGVKYCEAHTTNAVTDKRERNRLYDTQIRNQEAASFYNSKGWRVTRIRALNRDNYLCLMCLAGQRIKRADLVDHIKPYEHYPELALDLDNLQSLCNRCHRLKTAEDLKKYANGRIDGLNPMIIILDELT